MAALTQPAASFEAKFSEFLEEQKIRSRLIRVLAEQGEDAGSTSVMKSVDEYTEFNQLVDEVSNFLYQLYPNFVVTPIMGEVSELMFPHAIPTRRFPLHFLLQVNLSGNDWKEWFAIPIRTNSEYSSSYWLVRIEEFAIAIIENYRQLQWNQQQKSTSKPLLDLKLLGGGCPIHFTAYYPRPIRFVRYPVRHLHHKFSTQKK